MLKPVQNRMYRAILHSNCWVMWGYAAQFCITVGRGHRWEDVEDGVGIVGDQLDGFGRGGARSKATDSAFQTRPFATKSNAERPCYNTEH